MPKERNRNIEHWEGKKGGIKILHRNKKRESQWKKSISKKKIL